MEIWHTYVCTQALHVGSARVAHASVAFAQSVGMIKKHWQRIVCHFFRMAMLAKRSAHSLCSNDIRTIWNMLGITSNTLNCSTRTAISGQKVPILGFWRWFWEIFSRHDPLQRTDNTMHRVMRFFYSSCHYFLLVCASACVCVCVFAYVRIRAMRRNASLAKCKIQYCRKRQIESAQRMHARNTFVH